LQPIGLTCICTSINENDTVKLEYFDKLCQQININNRYILDNIFGNIDNTM